MAYLRLSSTGINHPLSTVPRLATSKLSGYDLLVNIIQAENLTKTYTIGERQIAVLDNISIAIAAGEFVAIMGSSGSGKSTLLSLLSGLDNPTEGQVLIEDQNITGLSEDELAPLRNETIGFVFQSFHLVPSLSALENIMFPAELRGDADAREKAEALLERVGLQERQTNFPHQLSGGEKQRVAICRSLINDPKILFADEPRVIVMQDGQVSKTSVNEH